MPRFERSLISKFCYGTLPLRIETGRYTNEALENRICNFCDLNEIEDEIHFAFHCPLYEQEKQQFIEQIDNTSFIQMNDIEKIKYCFEEKCRLLNLLNLVILRDNLFYINNSLLLSTYYISVNFIT